MTPSQVRARLRAFSEGRHANILKFAMPAAAASAPAQPVQKDDRYQIQQSPTGKQVVFDNQTNRLIYGQRARQIIAGMNRPDMPAAKAKPTGEPDPKNDVAYGTSRTTKEFLDPIDVKPTDSPEARGAIAKLKQQQVQYRDALDQFKVRDDADPDKKKWHKYASDVARFAVYQSAMVKSLRAGMSHEEADAKFRSILPHDEPLEPGDRKIVPEREAAKARKMGLLPPNTKVSPLTHTPVKEEGTGRILGWKERARPVQAKMEPVTPRKGPFQDVASQGDSLSARIDKVWPKSVFSKIRDKSGNLLPGNIAKNVVKGSLNYGFAINPNVSEEMRKKLGRVGSLTGAYASQWVSPLTRAPALGHLAISAVTAPVPYAANVVKRALGDKTASLNPMDAIDWETIGQWDNTGRYAANKFGQAVGTAAQAVSDSSGLSTLASAVGSGIKGAAFGGIQGAASGVNEQAGKAVQKILGGINNKAAKLLRSIGFAERTRMRLRAFSEGRHANILKFKADWQRVESKRAKHGFVMVNAATGTRVAGDRALQIAQRLQAGPQERTPRAPRAPRPVAKKVPAPVPTPAPESPPQPGQQPKLTWRQRLAATRARIGGAIKNKASAAKQKLAAVKSKTGAAIREKAAAMAFTQEERDAMAAAKAAGNEDEFKRLKKEAQKRAAKGAAKFGIDMAGFPPKERALMDAANEAIAEAQAAGDEEGVKKAKAMWWKGAMAGGAKMAGNYAIGFGLGLNPIKSVQLRQKYGGIPAILGSATAFGIANSPFILPGLHAAGYAVPSLLNTASLGVGLASKLPIAGGLGVNTAAWMAGDWVGKAAGQGLPWALKKAVALPLRPFVGGNRSRELAAKGVNAIGAATNFIPNLAFDFTRAAVETAGWGVGQAAKYAGKGLRGAYRLAKKAGPAILTAYGRSQAPWMRMSESLDMHSPNLLHHLAYRRSLHAIGTLLRRTARLQKFSETAHTTTLLAALVCRELTKQRLPLQTCRAAVVQTMQQALAISA